jgi:homoserine O-succinyltransferase
MPDAAIVDTERQLESLLVAAAGDMPVVVRYYSLPEVERGERATRYCREEYHDRQALVRSPPDALIVTGAEPGATELQAEPYWEPLVELLEWADTHVSSTICSCLAAHVALLQFSGVRRQRLRAKCCGVFEHATTPHFLTRGLPSRTLVPHSRWNDVPAAETIRRGYQSLMHSEKAGTHLLVKQEGSLRVLMQGHPEYDALTLLREHRRDVKRYLEGSSVAYPDLPEGYFDPSAKRSLGRFRAYAERRRALEALEAFPFEFLAARVPNSWRSGAVRVMKNWLQFVSSRE